MDESNIATLTINRPEKKNSFSDVTIQELSSAFASVDSDPTIRGLIVKVRAITFARVQICRG